MKVGSNCFLLVLFIVKSTFVFGQLSNDDCSFAKFITKVDDYCSKDNEFTNKGATSDPVFPNSCISLKFGNGVWFSFIPKLPAVSIRVFSDGKTGSIKGPKIVLFEECNSLVECSPGKSNENDEFLYNKLVLGKVYYIMVESNIGGEGSFKLCLDELTSVKIPESDCIKAVKLCDKDPFVVNSLSGSGEVTNEVEKTNCISEEFQSSWYKWTCDKSGTLSFTLTPNNNSANLNVDITDDLDFSVYELPNGIDDCTGKTVVRCVAAGANTNGNTGAIDPVSTWSRCNGPTGLSESDSDLQEPAGCAFSSQNNFAKALDMVSGKSYVLVVNNYSRSGLGFAMKFGGSGTFLGPKVDFQTSALDRFECDKTITFTNKSEGETDPINSYQWNFGEGSSPPSSSAEGPVDVTYNSFGKKTTALTVTTTRGCTVTKILDLFINACCKDTSTLAVSAFANDIACYDFSTGQIEALGVNGSPKYVYSLDSIDFQPSARFSDLKAGNYTLYIRDKKGCTNKTPVIITQPPQIIVDAGEDIEVDLGEKSELNGSFTGGTGIGTPQWSPKDSIDFVDQFNTPFLPLKDKGYQLLVTDENGCTGTDIVNVRVKIIRPVFSPNIIKSGQDGINGIFRLEGGKAVRKIRKLEVYDRWGNKMYVGTDIDIKNFDEGWKADFNGKKVNPGVYVWLAVVEFIDDAQLTFSGDVTVVE